MNVTELTNALHTKINSSTDLEQILLLSKAVERLKLGNVNVVTNFSELSAVSFDPDAYGALYFVENQSQLYISTGPGIWVSILRSTEIAAYGWGEGSFGEHGSAIATDRSSPVSVVGGFTDWTQVSSGKYHSNGVRLNGTAWSWGRGSGGRLGDNTTVSKSSPVSVVGGYTDWIQIGSGQGHSAGLRSDGTVWTWGENASGQLGVGTTIWYSSPVSVIGGFTDWTQISVGSAHVLGIRSDGAAWGWGANASGRLGDGTVTNRSSPVSVVGGFTDWTQVSAGSQHSLGLRSNGTAWAWGYNGQGQLASGNTTSVSSPISVVGGFTDWTQLSAGRLHSLGVRSDGTAWAWGFGYAGRLGNNSTLSRLSPVSVVGGFTDWTKVSALNEHSVGIRTNGTAWSWGCNAVGRLGDNGLASLNSSPVSVSGGFTDWIDVSFGTSDHTLALRNNSSI